MLIKVRIDESVNTLSKVADTYLAIRVVSGLAGDRDPGDRYKTTAPQEDAVFLRSCCRECILLVLLRSKSCFGKPKPGRFRLPTPCGSIKPPAAWRQQGV
jgi:hypothetical protein